MAARERDESGEREERGNTREDQSLNGIDTMFCVRSPTQLQTLGVYTYSCNIIVISTTIANPCLHTIKRNAVVYALS